MRYAVFMWGKHEPLGGVHDYAGWIEVENPLDEEDTSAALRKFLVQREAGIGRDEGWLPDVISIADQSTMEEAACYEVSFAKGAIKLVRVGHPF